MSESIDGGQRILIDSIITLANAFTEAGCSPPRKLEVDSQTFDKLLAEALECKEMENLDNGVYL
jgi:hypothetical protein